MEREQARQSQAERGDVVNGTSPRTTTTPTNSTPTPPRLTPNPALAPPALTPTSSSSSSPPPPLTPAPSLSASHAPKTMASPPPSPHLLVPTPPKLTSTASPALRTYSRPILPSQTGASKPPSSSSSSSPAVHAAASSPTPPPSGLTSSSFSFSSSTPMAASTAASHPFSPSVTHGNVNSPPKASSVLTNGDARPMSTPSSTPITPFHTPASPTGRQVSQAHPLGTPGLLRANQIPSPANQRVSQQTLLLGKGLKGSGQDQVLLRAQMLILTSAMRPAPSSSSSSSSSSCSSSPTPRPASAQLQSLTLRPPPPGTLTIPPSLRLKPPSAVPPPLSRPRAPVFPPLKPRPQPSATVTEGQAAPPRHLSVPPPTLYSHVRAVPLRPRLHFPNGQRVVSPRQSAALQPLAAAPAACQAPHVGRPLTRPKSCPSSQASLAAMQPQPVPVSMSHPLTPSPHFEQSPSAARQLQIIALSSGRQSLSGASLHGQNSVQSKPPVMESHDLTGHSQRTFSGEDPSPPRPPPPPPANASMPKTSSPLPSPPPSLRCAASPPGQAATQTHPPAHPGDNQSRPRERAEQGDGEGRVAGHPRQEAAEGGVGKDARPEREEEDGREEKMREEQQVRGMETGEGAPVDQTEQRIELDDREEERMEGVEEGQGGGDPRRRGGGGGEDEEVPAMDQSEPPTDQRLHQHQHLEPGQKMNPDPLPVRETGPDPKPVPGPVSMATPATEASAHSQRLSDPPRDLHSVSQEDLCEHMSTQSDNQSALSSLSSQSPPSSPFIISPSDNPVAPLPAQPARPANLGLPQRRPEVDTVDRSLRETTGHLDQSDDKCEAFGRAQGGPWAPKAWPEGGRQVLTHLVEGFVIQEGLQPFPVNRSSLLVQEQVTKPQDMNGTNGTEVFLLTDTSGPGQPEHSTDSDGLGGATTEDQVTTGERDKAVLQCQFCGKRGHAHNFMRSKRFCSTSCARGFNVRLTKRLRALSAGSRSERPRPALNRAESVPGKPLLLRLTRNLWSTGRREKEEKEKPGEEDEGEAEEEDGAEEEEDPAVAMATKMERRAARRARRASEPAVSTSTPTTTFKPRPAQWSVEEVTEFIHTLPGCSEVAEAFRVQEIDGQALLLLTEDHLMTSMNIKLGPALKICAHINALKHQ